MTQLRTRCKCGISNYFDTILQGIGKRGSSFMDLDAVTHDRDGRRFLFQEFKRPGEPLEEAQRQTLRDLALLPRCTVWFVRRIGNGRVGWAQFGSGRLEETITEDVYRALFRAWWQNVPYATPVSVGRADVPVMTADEIPW